MYLVVACVNLHDRCEIVGFRVAYELLVDGGMTRFEMIKKIIRM